MKTKELIKILQQADPTGNEEVSVGNTDILCVSKMPSYYDGRQEVLIRNDNEKPYYNIIGAKIRTSGDKIQIIIHSIYDSIDDNINLPIEYEENNDYLKKAHDNYRKKVQQELIKMKEEGYDISNSEATLKESFK